MTDSGDDKIYKDDKNGKYFSGEGGAETWEGEREEPTQEQASVLEKGGRILFRLKNEKKKSFGQCAKNRVLQWPLP